MKERPKNFRSEEVKAIQEGRKTQFQEAIKIPKYGRIKPATHYDPPCDSHDGGVAICFDQSGLASWETLACPYGRVGDRLWCRESWVPSFHGLDCVYKADEIKGELFPIDKWKPPISMPRWASRITLEITEIDVQYLNRWVWEITFKKLV